MCPVIQRRGPGTVYQRVVIGALVLWGWSGCAAQSGEKTGSTQADSGADVQQLGAIDTWLHAPTVLPGSRLLARGAGFDRLASSAKLVLEGTNVSLPIANRKGSELEFEVDAAALAALGHNPWTGLVHIQDPTLRTLSREVTLAVGHSLPVQLHQTGAPEVHFGESWIVRGQGLLEGMEGGNQLHFEGMFESTNGDVIEVSTALPVEVAERFQRERGVVRFDESSLAGLQLGRFAGTIFLVTTTAGGLSQTSLPLEALLDIRGPEVYEFRPSELRLGQYVEVNGAGFLGAAETIGSTVFVLAGNYANEGEAEPRTVVATIVPQVVDHTTARFVLNAEVDADRLVSALTGQPSGRFEGELRAQIASSAGEMLESDVLPLAFDVNTRGQVVHLVFLTGFHKSIGLFGLSSLLPELKAAIRQEIESIYGPWHLDVRLEEPHDFDRNHFSRVEFGGPDPNGIGLFGFDNSPGKDVGNLRLFDAIGGANAATQADGHPGYGGVFVEAFLYFSQHPPLPSPRPAWAPAPEPAFDAIFDPVRLNPATLAEFLGEGEAERVEQVQLAAHSLARLIAETAAHEIAHSLGLADPHGPASVFHNLQEGEGCLMDAAGDRPFAERAGLPGAWPTRFCYEHPNYLDQVLGPRAGRE